MGQLLNFTKLKWLLLLLIPAGLLLACDDDDIDEPDYSVGFPSAAFSNESSESTSIKASFDMRIQVPEAVLVLEMDHKNLCSIEVER